MIIVGILLAVGVIFLALFISRRSRDRSSARSHDSSNHLLPIWMMANPPPGSSQPASVLPVTGDAPHAPTHGSDHVCGNETGGFDAGGGGSDGGGGGGGD